MPPREIALSRLVQTLDLGRAGAPEVKEKLREVNKDELEIVTNLAALTLAMDVHHSLWRVKKIDRYSEMECGMFYKTVLECMGVYQTLTLDCIRAEFAERSMVSIGSVFGVLHVIEFEQPPIDPSILKHVSDAVRDLTNPQEKPKTVSSDLDEIDEILGRKVKSTGKPQ